MQSAPANTLRCDPVIILAPPRSFTSVISSMLGQHPQLYALPELYLFGCETMADWWVLSRNGRTHMADGLLRAVAELTLGSQTEQSVELARYWVSRHQHLEVVHVFRGLARLAWPRATVEKTPRTSFRLESLLRSLRAAPRARYLHLVRHPVTHSQSLMRVLTDEGARDVELIRDWQQSPFGSDLSQFEPERVWYWCHTNILRFLLDIPEERKHTLRGEALLEDPDRYLQAIAQWLGVRHDKDALEAMQHPERSPFARRGPPNAPWGEGPDFLQAPALRVGPPPPSSLDDLPVRNTGRPGLRAAIRRLATELGYS